MTAWSNREKEVVAEAAAKLVGGGMPVGIGTGGSRASCWLVGGADPRCGDGAPGEQDDPAVRENPASR